ncbi:MAG: hypothetical protein HY692_05940 [Cyanobacteria bacterium NC_groundwater_1444_Ag_S-0.65um_54_12]|nr:hypothetical protein [Cyanobacteria bacterium NC_groundwater_1444_Ag_S-0.65um_54_12]
MPQRRIWLLTVSLTITGCSELGEQIKPLLPDFLRNSLFPTQEEPSAPSMVPVPRSRHPRKLAGTIDSEPASVSRLPALQNNHEQYRVRNMEFDHLRTTGIDLLYAGETDRAIKVFKEALKKKPGDKSVENLLRLAEHPPTGKLEGIMLPPARQPAGVPPLPGHLPTN